MITIVHSFRSLPSVFLHFFFGFWISDRLVPVCCRTRLNHRLTSLLMMLSHVVYYLLNLLERSNFDLIYLAWLWSLFKPLCLLLLSLFLLPATIFLLIYGSSLFCLIYKHWNRLKVGEFKELCMIKWLTKRFFSSFRHLSRPPILMISGTAHWKPWRSSGNYKERYGMVNETIKLRFWYPSKNDLRLHRLWSWGIGAYS